jgi:hypothetical protein
LPVSRFTHDVRGGLRGAPSSKRPLFLRPKFAKSKGKAMFKKGQSGNPAGKKPGTKNKSYLSLNVWFELIHDRMQKLPDEQVLAYSFRAAELLLSKVQMLPTTPGESVSNAAMVAALEAQRTQASLEVPPNAPGLAMNGETNGSSPSNP